MDGVPLPGSELTGTSSGSGSGGASSGSVLCTAVPTCDDASDEAVSSESDCIADGICYSRTRCGETIWCTRADVHHCDGRPECPAGSTKVSGACPSDGECVSVSMCGETIHCLKSCEGPQPICDAGDTEVSGPSQCLQDDAVCYTRSICGHTIWCTGPAS